MVEVPRVALAHGVAQRQVTDVVAQRRAHAGVRLRLAVLPEMSERRGRAFYVLGERRRSNAAISTAQLQAERVRLGGVISGFGVVDAVVPVEDGRE